jgi:hypothetical protein
MSRRLDICWESLLATDAPADCKLAAALFTTYERADERFLVEHLLPTLLRTEKEPDSEGLERQYFLLELHEKLERLHDRLVVVSSNAREEPVTGEERDSAAGYSWIWRHVRALVVGRDGKAVQHAKLWMLHWTSTDGPEHLEIVVSSANLTRSAFQGQLQGAWRECIQLQPRASEARVAGWGVLPDFLRALATSCGDPTRLNSFIALLSRAVCPAGVTFVASVPGKHSRQALRRMPWGAAGLTGIAPPGRGTVSVSVLAPYVGAWSTDSLESWCAAFGSAPTKLELIWLDRYHPWAERWLLPATTLEVLRSLSASLIRLCNYADVDAEFSQFHHEHHQADPRWSHAKLYCFRLGRSRRVLVTSANFSMAAWGTPGTDGSLSIENFELGVCIKQSDWPFEGLEPLGKDVATVARLPTRSSGPISWTDASWDGKSVRIECRCLAKSALEAVLRAGNEVVTFPDWERTEQDHHLCCSAIVWRRPWASPFVVELTCEDETLSVPVFDTRPGEDREDTLPGEVEVDVDTAQVMRDRLLFEEYGGRLADPDDPPIDGADPGGNGATADLENSQRAGHDDSYAVPAFVLARQHFAVVDNWAENVRKAVPLGVHADHQIVGMRDGERLTAAFVRQAKREERLGNVSIGAKIAGEEIALRLKLFRSA